MKKSIHKLICLALTISGLSFYACQQDECVEGKHQQTLVKDAVTEARNDDGSLYCNVTTTAVGQLDSLITAWETKNDVPKDGITHLTISGPIDNNDITTMCNFLYLDSLILTDAKIEKITQHAFYKFRSKANIVLPKTVKTIEREAFEMCTYSPDCRYNIKSIYIQDSVTTIGEYAFRDCQKMESIRLPKSITKLPRYVFEYCVSLKEVAVPEYVGTIEEYAFKDCHALTNVEMSNKVVYINNGAFSTCTSLESIKWPSFCHEIKPYCFKDCTNLKFEIPGGITEIGAHAFDGCTKMVEYKIPEKLVSIGEYAYARTGITSLTLTDKMLLSNGIFEETPIASLTISEGVTNLPAYIFNNCDKLQTLKFPSTMKSLGGKAFRDCDGITSIELNENIETIDDHAFQSLDLLKSITITAKTVLDRAFDDCNQLETVIMTDKVTTIGGAAFDGCEKLVNIQWSNNLEYIGGYAFRENKSLKEFVAPSSLKTIDDYAFSDAGLEKVLLNEGLETIGSRSFQQTSLKEFVAPSTLKSIDESAFNGNGYLVNVTLNEGLTSIGSYAFSNTPIETITIPSTLEGCGTHPFYYCSKLTSVFWKSSIEAPDLSPYNDESTNILLYLTHGKSSVDNPIQIVNGKSQTTIILRSGGNFHCPESFVSDMQYDRVFNRRYDYVSDRVSDEEYYDSNYSFQNIPGQASCWQTIVLPFEVTSIKCGDKELVPFGVEKEGAYPFWLRELTSNGFVRATKIEANKPYIIAMPNNEAYADEYNIRGKVSFYAENVTIPVTEELKEVQGPKFNFYPTYTWLGKNAERLVLNRINEYYDSKQGIDYYYGSAFVANQYDLGSFGAYVSSPVGGRSVVPIESALSSRRTHKLGPIPQENDM